MTKPTYAGTFDRHARIEVDPGAYESNPDLAALVDAFAAAAGVDVTHVVRATIYRHYAEVTVHELTASGERYRRDDHIVTRTIAVLYPETT